VVEELAPYSQEVLPAEDRLDSLPLSPQCATRFEGIESCDECAGSAWNPRGLSDGHAREPTPQLVDSRRASTT
jgi:hypothetical protein